jgi:ferredoxin
VGELLARLPTVFAHVYYTGSVPAGQVGRVTAHTGRPDTETLRAIDLPPECDAYVCGPAAFMAGMTTSLAELGLDAAHIHSEAFGASAAPGSGPAVAVHAPDGPAGTGPSVTFARSGLTVPFSDRWGNLLKLAEACDVPVHWSCRTGVCHACVTPLVSGSVGYDPQPLDPPGTSELLLCCARPCEDIVLDA